MAKKLLAPFSRTSVLIVNESRIERAAKWIHELHVYELGHRHARFTTRPDTNARKEFLPQWRMVEERGEGEGETG